MANNFVNDGKVYSFVSDGSVAYTSGAIYTNGKLVGVINNSVVANTDATWGDLTDTQKTVVVNLFGCYELTVTSAATVAAGEKAYVSALEPTKVTNAESSVYVMGCFIGAKDSNNIAKVNLNIRN